MKGRFGRIIVCIVLLFSLTQCESQGEKKLVGVWQLKEMVVNGSALRGSSLGNWLWEFNDVGGYLTDIAGVREKGHYTLKKDVLTLKIVIPQSRASQVYQVSKLDEKELELVYIEGKNKSILRFMKRKVSDVGGTEKD